MTFYEGLELYMEDILTRFSDLKKMTYMNIENKVGEDTTAKKFLKVIKKEEVLGTGEWYKLFEALFKEMDTEPIHAMLYTFKDGVDIYLVKLLNGPLTKFTKGNEKLPDSLKDSEGLTYTAYRTETDNETGETKQSNSYIVVYSDQIPDEKQLETMNEYIKDFVLLHELGHIAINSLYYKATKKPTLYDDEPFAVWANEFLADYLCFSDKYGKEAIPKFVEFAEKIYKEDHQDNIRDFIKDMIQYENTIQ